jgi:acyl carrier protein
VVEALVQEAEPAEGFVITSETALGDASLGLSSLSFMRVLIRLEDSCGVDLDDEVVMTSALKTVGDLERLMSASF